MKASRYTVTTTGVFFIYFSRKPLIPCIEKQLLGQHLTSILQKGKLIKCTYIKVRTGPGKARKSWKKTTGPAKSWKSA